MLNGKQKNPGDVIKIKIFTGGANIYLQEALSEFMTNNQVEGFSTACNRRGEIVCTVAYLENIFEDELLDDDSPAPNPKSDSIKPKTKPKPGLRSHPTTNAPLEVASPRAVTRPSRSWFLASGLMVVQGPQLGQIGAESPAVKR